MINSIESMSKKKFPRPGDDFGANGSIFYLYPMEWPNKTMLCITGILMEEQQPEMQ